MIDFYRKPQFSWNLWLKKISNFIFRMHIFFLWSTEKIIIQGHPPLTRLGWHLKFFSLIKFSEYLKGVSLKNLFYFIFTAKALSKKTQGWFLIFSASSFLNYLVIIFSFIPSFSTSLQIFSSLIDFDSQNETKLSAFAVIASLRNMAKPQCITFKRIK